MVGEDLHDILGATTFGGFDELCSALGGNRKKRCAWAEWRGESPKWVLPLLLVGFEGWVCILQRMGAFPAYPTRSCELANVWHDCFFEHDRRARRAWRLLKMPHEAVILQFPKAKVSDHVLHLRCGLLIHRPSE